MAHVTHLFLISSAQPGEPVRAANSSNRSRPTETTAIPNPAFASRPAPRIDQNSILFVRPCDPDTKLKVRRRLDTRGQSAA